MMNRQSLKMLSTLISSSGREIRLEEFAQNLGVSVRQVRNYINDIQEFLAKRELLHYFTTKNGCFVFTGDPKARSTITNALASMDFYEYHLNGEERQYLMALVLLNAKKPTKIATLEEMFYASKATIQSNLEDVRKFFGRFQMDFDKNKHRGLVLVGHENKKRDALFEALNELNLFSTFPWQDERANVLSRFAQTLLGINPHRKACEAALKASEAHFHLNLLDLDFYEIVLTLCVILARLKQGHNIDAPLERMFSINGISINLSEHVFRTLCTEKPVREEEIQYFANRLHRKTLILNQESEEGKHANFHIVVKSLLYKLSLEYNNDLIRDYRLHEYLTGHIFSVYHRAKENAALKNPFKDQMMREYARDFDILKRNISILENGLGCVFTDDEITYMLMHIIAALERSYQAKPVPDVILACNTGMGTANFLAAMIKKHLHVNILSITSSHAIDVLLARQHCDLIISTVPLHVTRTPWVQVSAVPQKEDIERIKTALNDVYASVEPRRQSMKRTALPAMQIHTQPQTTPMNFVDLLKADHIRLDKSVNNWKEAIITCAEPMLFDGFIEPAYVAEMINVVLENGPYIVFAPGVAIAHANPRFGVHKFSAAFLRLKEPVKFDHPDNDPVKYVIAVGVDDSAQCTNALFHIMNIMVNPLALSLLEQAKCQQDILDVLRRFEQNSQNLTSET